MSRSAGRPSKGFLDDWVPCPSSRVFYTVQPVPRLSNDVTLSRLIRGGGTIPHHLQLITNQMDTPSTPSRPRQSHRAPIRESTTSHRVTRSRAAFQNVQPPSSSLSPPPEPEEQGGASHHTTHLTVPAETQSNNNISQIDQAAAPTDAGQAPTPNTPKKRKTPAEVEDDSNDGPLLSEYMCPICFSPPTGAIVTLCGHIMCGACLYGAITARGAPPQKLCPVCRTPIPNLQFALPAPTIPPPPAPAPRRPLEPRTIAGIGLPTAGQDMVDPNWDQEVIDVDDDEPVIVEPRLDPARSGVVGLEILTLGVDEVV
ncbi:unnamed protein product [Rhizoctonia solani]|uniref:RING-type domain-containing protein n=1 Tax=Rhizoctonia solani TaxID=456999 RepID=A0A8H3E2D1_9AGAM|nr:unnamed protein product [Rhizoctonia solani]